MIDIARVRDLIDAIWNRDDLDAIDQLFGENFVSHNPQNPIEGPDGFRAWYHEVKKWSPDFHINLHETVVQDDLVATRWTASGTDSGPFRSMTPTGKHYVVTGMTLSKFSDGKIVESWVNMDDLGLLQQLGVVPELIT